MLCVHQLNNVCVTLLKRSPLLCLHVFTDLGNCGNQADIIEDGAKQSLQHTPKGDFHTEGKLLLGRRESSPALIVVVTCHASESCQNSNLVILCGECSNCHVIN